MSKCPSAIDIALFADGQMTGDEAMAIRTHATDCPACAEALINIVQVHDLASDGHLPVVEASEQAAVFQRWEDWMAGAMGEDNQIDADRNEASDDSAPSEGHEGAGDHSAEETQAMNSDHNGEHMQDAIKSVFGPAEMAAPDVIGHDAAPGLFSPGIQQSYSDTCAIRCQELVLQDFGLPVTQSGLVLEAQGKGWYTPGLGTPEDDLGKLIEAHGIPVHRYEQANIFNLVSELAQGHRVILTVDSGELWSTNDILKPVAELNQELWEDGLPDHAVIVSGVDVSDPQNPVVIVTDPGTGEVAAQYSMTDFLAAWEDSGFSMVATAEAPSQFTADHVAYIGNLDYDQFAQWYPSVSQMNGHEAGFEGLCANFDRMVSDPAFHAQHSLTDAIVGHVVEPLHGAVDAILPLLGLAHLNSSDTDADDGQDDDDHGIT